MKFCFLCNQPGHDATECPLRRKAPPKPRFKGPYALRRENQWLGWDDLTQSIEYAPADSPPPKEFVFQSLKDIEELKRCVGPANTEMVSLGEG